MTNEQKAREIAIEFGKDYSDFAGYTEVKSCTECYESAIEMAKWKEQQMIDWIRKNAYIYIVTENDSEGNLCEKFLEDAFIDDFKKAMKGE